MIDCKDYILYMPFEIIFAENMVRTILRTVLGDNKLQEGVDFKFDIGVN